MWAVLKATLAAISRFYTNNDDGNAVLEEVQVYIFNMYYYFINLFDV
jgi:hypothetical protein